MLAEVQNDIGEERKKKIKGKSGVEKEDKREDDFHPFIREALKYPPITKEETRSLGAQLQKHEIEIRKLKAEIKKHKKGKADPADPSLEQLEQKLKASYANPERKEILQKIVTGNFGLAFEEAFHYRTYGYNIFNEALQAANDGLIEAALHYDPSRAEFSTYAKKIIKGKIRVALRKDRNVIDLKSYALQQAKAVSAAQETLGEKRDDPLAIAKAFNRRALETSELKSEKRKRGKKERKPQKMSAQKAEFWSGIAGRVQTVSLSTPLYTHSPLLLEDILGSSPDNLAANDYLANTQMIAVVEKILEKMKNKRYQKIIKKYYGLAEDENGSYLPSKTQAEIAAEEEVTEPRIHQIIKKAIEQLQNAIKEFKVKSMADFRE